MAETIGGDYCVAKELTNKQKAFAEAYAAGVDRIDAAIAAGYSKSGAPATASQLLARADVKAHIKRLKSGKDDPSADDDAADEQRSYLADKYKDPLSFMLALMNNPKAPAGVRYAAAKDALPYMHGRIGEQGKKEKAAEASKKVAAGGRFGVPKAPVKLRSVA